MLGGRLGKAAGDIVIIQLIGSQVGGEHRRQHHDSHQDHANPSLGMGDDLPKEFADRPQCKQDITQNLLHRYTSFTRGSNLWYTRSVMKLQTTVITANRRRIAWESR